MTQIFDSPVEYSTQRTGSLIVITGSMFSGKTEELIRRVRRALYAHRSAQVFKHTIDTRSENTEIRSHNGVPHEALAVSTSEEPAAATATKCPKAFSSTDSPEYRELW